MIKQIADYVDLRVFEGLIICEAVHSSILKILTGFSAEKGEFERIVETSLPRAGKMGHFILYKD